MGSSKLLFVRKHEHIRLKSIRSMKRRIEEKWSISEAYLTNEDVRQADSYRELFELQKLRAGRKRKLNYSRKLHKKLIIHLKHITKHALDSNIMKNDAIPWDIRCYIEDFHELLKK